MDQFVLRSEFAPTGDQPQAIDQLVEGFRAGTPCQTLLGVTGSGKTFTMANVIARLNRPTLVIAHNKTLAAQLCAEFKAFFPDSAVEYFVSYYDYYQPEAYIASSDTYIEKDASINEEIDRLRHSATAALRERRDVIIVSSVSCIYSMGDPSEYEGQMISLRPGMEMKIEDLLRRLVDIQYERNDYAFDRGNFRVRGDVVEIIPAGQKENGIRVEFFGDEIDRICEFSVIDGHVLHTVQHTAVYPATHYATSMENREENLACIEHDMALRIEEFEKEGKLLEAQRIGQRTRYDIEMLREIGMCNGIENYSRYFDGRKPGDPPFCLLDYFPDDFLLMIDESHVTVPQIRAMYAGDRARKEALVEYGFRLPSAFDNRPLRFEEFLERIHQTLFVSATPAPWEVERSGRIVEQIIRPTGLLDPRIIVRPATGQVDDLVGELHQVIAKGERVLVTTLTKRMAEQLTDYLDELGIRVRYLHSDIQTMERTKLIRELRMGEYDVLVGINLLREGLDLPEVSLVAILDADKEGFLRSETSLVQTIGRAARNAEGRVIMYADTPTQSMMNAISETNRRRAIQEAYNEAHGITPETIRTAVRALLEITDKASEEIAPNMAEDEKDAWIKQLEEQMLTAATALDFEKAAKLRDQLFAIRGDTPINKHQPTRRRRPSVRKPEH
ncbi:MAG: excinuclease ABC subunit UvrB [Clostridia bacterium]|nr:excinuclease ABC subunit UvrB [Clostridia bacterium]